MFNWLVIALFIWFAIELGYTQRSLRELRETFYNHSHVEFFKEDEDND